MRCCSMQLLSSGSMPAGETIGEGTCVSPKAANCSHKTRGPADRMIPLRCVAPRQSCFESRRTCMRPRQVTSTHISAPLHPTHVFIETFVRCFRPALSLGEQRKGFHIVPRHCLIIAVSIRQCLAIFPGSGQIRAPSIQIYPISHLRMVYLAQQRAGYRCQSLTPEPRDSHLLPL